MALKTFAPILDGDFLESESEGYRSREQILLAASPSADLLGSTQLGRTLSGSAVVAAKSGGNTGNGTFVIDATNPVLTGGRPGIYTARFTSTTNIRIEDPDGVVIADVPIVATTAQTAQVQEQIKALVTEGGTTFVVGDGFDISVGAITYTYAPMDFTSTTGLQKWAATLFSRRAALAATQRGVGIVRSAEVNGNKLTYVNAPSAAQKAAVEAQMAAAGVIVRY